MTVLCLYDDDDKEDILGIFSTVEAVKEKIKDAYTKKMKYDCDEANLLSSIEFEEASVSLNSVNLKVEADILHADGFQDTYTRYFTVDEYILDE